MFFKLRSNVDSSIWLPIITGKTEAELYNRKVTIAGWDVAENTVNPRFMKTAKLQILEPEQCPFDEIRFPSRIDKLMRKIYICSKTEPVVTLTSVSVIFKSTVLTKKLLLLYF